MIKSNKIKIKIKITRGRERMTRNSKNTTPKQPKVEVLKNIKIHQSKVEREREREHNGPNRSTKQTKMNRSGLNGPN